MGATSAHEHLTPPEPVKRARKAAKKASTNKRKTRKRTSSTRTAEASPPTPRRRKGTLVIVESPAKARTIENYLGKDFKVRASVGHVRDLLKSQLSVDIENDFEPRYRILNDKRDVIKELRSAAASAKQVYLATDPDREGEAIAWHLVEAMELDENDVQRVVFHEITRDAVNEAFEQPRHIDMDRVNAQQARRILDRLVGYELSPLLWRKVRPRLSAGRVQSVAVRMIVEREREIESFVPEEYWTIDAELARVVEREVPERIHFLARLVRINGDPISLPTQGEVDPILRDLDQAEYIVESVKRGTRKRAALPPFITSTLQQEASRRLGFTARRAMQIAQQLYEGMDVGPDGEVGLITYMRTDSTNIAGQAQQEAARYITEAYGKDYLPSKPNVYTKKAVGAQDAHEAIRPTSTYRTPQALKSYLTRDQFRLYELIWQRFVASQMAPAVYDTISVDVAAGKPGDP
jgi:DNA topoisomerase-1